jgi:hypothetical protein
VAGDVNGKFSSFFSRIETVNSKNGPFDMLLVAGMQQNESTRLALFRRVSDVRSINLHCTTGSFFSLEPDQDDPDWMSYLSGDKQGLRTHYVRE